MKILIDSTWGFISELDENNHKENIFHNKFPMYFQNVLNKILTKSQLWNFSDNKIIFTLSKKRTELFKEIINSDKNELRSNY